MRLAQIQREFLDRILADAPPGDAGLAIYHRNALAARCGSLAAAYPVVRRLVGEAFFGEAAARYARARPSASGDLHAYGMEFPAFLAAYAPARALACLPDVARLEWAVHECSFAGDGAPLDHAALGALPPEELACVRLRLHPAARLVASDHPILAVWEANQEGRDGTPERDTGADLVLVRRQGHAAIPALVDRDTWTLLEAFARGRTLAQACDALARPEEAFAPALARAAALGGLGPHEIDSPP